MTQTECKKTKCTVLYSLTPPVQLVNEHKHKLGDKEMPTESVRAVLLHHSHPHQDHPLYYNPPPSVNISLHVGRCADELQTVFCV